MITLNAPVTYTPPPLGGKTFPTAGPLSALAVAITDDPDAQNGKGVPNGIVTAKILGVPKTLALWQGAAYAAIGDWTQAQAAARINTLLGGNPAAVIEGLF